MRIINFGSINLDFVYQVEHFVQPGETMKALSFERFAGGKGFNQSIALARAGSPPNHIGQVGEDGRELVEQLQHEDVDISRIEVVDGPTGHAIIQVDPSGENNIIVSVYEGILTKFSRRIEYFTFIIIFRNPPM